MCFVEQSIHAISKQLHLQKYSSKIVFGHVVHIPIIIYKYTRFLYRMPDKVFFFAYKQIFFFPNYFCVEVILKAIWLSHTREKKTQIKINIFCYIRLKSSDNVLTQKLL